MSQKSSVPQAVKSVSQVLMSDKESNREDYLASLSQLMDLHFDVLVPWGSEAGQPYGYGVTHSQARQNLEKIMKRLRAGENA